LGLVVLIVGAAEIASRLVLSAIWWILVVFGGATLFFRARMRPIIPFSKWNWTTLPIITVAGVAICTNLIIAIAPSTKIDELYYHMLMPSRIVTDGALHFYREPWPSAIWPHMIYQIASAPVHAIGYPDAANVVSWGLAVTLLCFAWQILRDHSK